MMSGKVTKYPEEKKPQKKVVALQSFPRQIEHGHIVSPALNPQVN